MIPTVNNKEHIVTLNQKMLDRMNAALKSSSESDEEDGSEKEIEVGPWGVLLLNSNCRNNAPIFTDINNLISIFTKWPKKIDQPDSVSTQFQIL